MSRRRDLLSSDPNAFPRVFGTYLLLAPLGKGGMGEVFLAKRRLENGVPELCVVKTLRQDLGQDREYVTRFIDEARVVVTLNHSNICHVFDVGKSAEGQYYLGMEYLSGLDAKTLGDRAAERHAGVPPAAAVQVAIDVLAALDYAHKRKHPLTGEPLELIHRDVSPHNVVVGYDGVSKLIDFGLASSRLKIEQTAPNVVMGKMAYMGPEQARGDAIDARADQFAIAMVLYELLAGERFYEGLTPNEIWNTVGKGGFRPRLWKDATDKHLRAILDKALHKEAKKRYPDCATLRRILVEYLHGHFSLSGEDAVRLAITDLAGHDLEDEWERMAGFTEVSLSGFTHELEVTGRLAQVIAQASPDVRPERPSQILPRTATHNEPTALLPRDPPPPHLAESTELVDRQRRPAATEVVRTRSSSGPHLGYQRESTELVRDRPGLGGDRGVIIVHPSKALPISPRPSKPLVALVAGLGALLLLAVGALIAVVFTAPDEDAETLVAVQDPGDDDETASHTDDVGERNGPVASGPTGMKRTDDPGDVDDASEDEHDAPPRAGDRRGGKGERRDKRDLDRGKKAREEAERRAAADRTAAERAASEKAAVARASTDRAAAEKAAAVERALREEERQRAAREEVKALLAKGKKTMADKGFTSSRAWPAPIREAYDAAKSSGTDVAKATAFELGTRVARAPEPKALPSSSTLDLKERLMAMKRCLPAQCAKDLLGEYSLIQSSSVSAGKRKVLEGRLRDCEIVCRAQR